MGTDLRSNDDFPDAGEFYKRDRLLKEKARLEGLQAKLLAATGLAVGELVEVLWPELDLIVRTTALDEARSVQPNEIQFGGML